MQTAVDEWLELAAGQKPEGSKVGRVDCSR